MAQKTNRPARRLRPIPRQRELRELWDELSLGRKRIGSTAEQRLRWLVGFARSDLAMYHPEERIALGYDLGALIHEEGTGPITRLPDRLLRKAHSEIRRGIYSLLKDGWWACKLSQRLVVRRERDVAKKKFRISLAPRGNEMNAILGRMLDLLVRAGDRLRACQECDEPLVARRRQAYCSVRCSQLTRDRRKRERESS